LRIRLLDDDHALRFDDLCLHDLLFIRLQIALFLRLLAHPLHGIHYVLLLREERIAKIGGPLDVISQPLYHVGQARHRLNTRVPRLLGNGSGERLILQAGVFRKPLLQLNELQRIRGRCQRLRKQRIWVERHRSYQ
jgi:hypothetical protein